MLIVTLSSVLMEVEHIKSSEIVSMLCWQSVAVVLVTEVKRIVVVRNCFCISD